MQNIKVNTYLLMTLVMGLSATSVDVQSIEAETKNVNTVTDFTPLTHFGDNPGELLASVFLPKAKMVNNKQQNKLVVLLHGCGQNGETLSRQSGLLDLAKSHQFSLLIPQQVSTNNATACFNWFSQQDQQTEQGESLSIMNMIRTVQSKFKLEQVYIVGLSAGGAMASNLLSQYPGSFEAGAIIAGIPFPCADNLVKAISCMKSGSDLGAKLQADRIMKLNKGVKQWPKLTIISGSADGIVNPKNSLDMAQQWSQLHQVSEQAQTQKGTNMTTTYWGDTKNVELIELDNIGHGFPVNPNVKGGGTVAPFVVASDLSAAQYLVEKWIN
ncbi:PHB depolymerase family esterase [uncultured Psychrosphaera sp.]|uniref:extracellular catalytic domain type 1 short-chain-length polyhydroxyalkanoate depolymerase n=1 Tax=uncultured Psychrosphaera sp. TaxID=1403522 RepID=UPI0030F8F917